MISFEPLRDLLQSRNISFRKLREDCGISSNAAVALNNDQSVRLDVLVVICRYLNVHIEDVVKITLEDNA